MTVIADVIVAVAAIIPEIKINRVPYHLKSRETSSFLCCFWIKGYKMTIKNIIDMIEKEWNLSLQVHINEGFK